MPPVSTESISILNIDTRYIIPYHVSLTTLPFGTHSMLPTYFECSRTVREQERRQKMAEGWQKMAEGWQKVVKE